MASVLLAMGGNCPNNLKLSSIHELFFAKNVYASLHEIVRLVACKSEPLYVKVYASVTPILRYKKVPPLS